MTDKTTGDVAEALDAIIAKENEYYQTEFPEWDEKKRNDTDLSQIGSGITLRLLSAIRRALTQQPDVNLGLLEACKKTIRDFVHETTRLSAENLGNGVNYNGSHDCRISKATLEQGRNTLEALARAEQKGGV